MVSLGPTHVDVRLTLINIVSHPCVQSAIVHHGTSIFVEQLNHISLGQWS